ncbi:MAG: 3-dehydroquinate synthase [bacterium]|nr:3-dehydroquinate synthase [bacterium]
MRAIELDKKVRKKAVRWVLLMQIGETVFRNDVSSEVVRSVVEELAGM